MIGSHVIYLFYPRFRDRDDEFTPILAVSGLLIQDFCGEVPGKQENKIRLIGD
jgi:hypothetical protein